MKVIIAIDQSVYWKQIVESVLKHSWPAGTCFKVLTVVEPTQLDEYSEGRWQDLLVQVTDQRNKAASEVLAQARRLLETNLPEGSVHTELRKGKARKEIVKTAAEWMADKIIVGAHGRSPNRLLLQGTVPATVAQDAHCTVELVRLKVPVETSDSKEVSAVLTA